MCTSTQTNRTRMMDTIEEMLVLDPVDRGNTKDKVLYWGLGLKRVKAEPNRKKADNQEYCDKSCYLGGCLVSSQ